MGVNYVLTAVLFALFCADSVGWLICLARTRGVFAFLGTDYKCSFDSGRDELDGTCTQTPPCRRPAPDPSDRGTHGVARLARSGNRAPW